MVPETLQLPAREPGGIVQPESVRHFIGGKHVHSTLRKSYGVTDPATGKEYAQVEVGLGADINQAVLAARSAFEAGPWPGMAAPERARILHAIADAVDERAGDIAAAEAQAPACRSPGPGSRPRGRARPSAPPPT